MEAERHSTCAVLQHFSAILVFFCRCWQYFPCHAFTCRRLARKSEGSLTVVLLSASTMAEWHTLRQVCHFQLWEVFGWLSSCWQGRWVWVVWCHACNNTHYWCQNEYDFCQRFFFVLVSLTMGGHIGCFCLSEIVLHLLMQAKAHR